MAKTKKLVVENTSTARVVRVFNEYCPNKSADVGALSFFLSVGVSDTLRMIADAIDDGKVEIIGGNYRLVR